MANLALPGNPRYQPRSLTSIFGYDNLIRTVVQVEIAALQTLGEAGFIPAHALALLTPEVEDRLLAIPTTLVDQVERQDTPEFGTKTRHDVRALVRIMQNIVPEPLRCWVHVPLTSYDVLDTARTLQFIGSYNGVVRPKIIEVIQGFRDQALKYVDQVQIGRTHGQHALPVTVGFWFATILSRLLFNMDEMDRYSSLLVGKISGAVGAYNAQAELGIIHKLDTGLSFEERVLQLLGLPQAPISTQILPPEPLAYYLHSCLMLSATLGQFGRDCRHLMRTEIGELREPFDAGQVGSSTMAHKRNPINFENLEGMWLRNRSEYGKVLDTLISEHQRDLVGSSLMRDFPIIIVNLVQQLDTLLRAGEDGVPFLLRITVDTEACQRNLDMLGDVILAEPLYLALQIHGYEGDAHELVNHQAMPIVQKSGVSLWTAVGQLAESDEKLHVALERIPSVMKSHLQNPASYVGHAREKTREICLMADRAAG